MSEPPFSHHSPPSTNHIPNATPNVAFLQCPNSTDLILPISTRTYNRCLQFPKNLFIHIHGASISIKAPLGNPSLRRLLSLDSTTDLASNLLALQFKDEHADSHKEEFEASLYFLFRRMRKESNSGDTSPKPNPSPPYYFVGLIIITDLSLFPSVKLNCFIEFQDANINYSTAFFVNPLSFFNILGVNLSKPWYCLFWISLRSSAIKLICAFMIVMHFNFETLLLQQQFPLKVDCKLNDDKRWEFSPTVILNQTNSNVQFGVSRGRTAETKIPLHYLCNASNSKTFLAENSKALHNQTVVRYKSSSDDLLFF